MRFPTAWASTASQNVTLKICVLVLGFLLLILGVTSTKLALKAPLIIDRTCYSTMVNAGSAKHTQQEIEGFLKEAIAQRFNSDVFVKEGFLSEDELKFRTQEQVDLKRREMSQKVILNPPAKVDGNTITIDADRLISIAKVRSAFSFPLIIIVSDTSRTESNPYGLLIEKVTAVGSGGLNDSKGK